MSFIVRGNFIGLMIMTAIILIVNLLRHTPPTIRHVLCCFTIPNIVINCIETHLHLQCKRDD